MSNLTLAEKLQATTELFDHIMKVMPIVVETLGEEATWIEKKSDEFDMLTITKNNYPYNEHHFVLLGWIEGEEKEINIPHDLITTPLEGITQWAIDERNKRTQRRLEAEQRKRERDEAKRKAEEDKDRATIEALKAKHNWK